MDKKPEKLVPEVRFKGFTDDWEQRKLGKSLSLLKDGTHGSYESVQQGAWLLSAKNIINNRVVITSNDRKISENDFKKIHDKFQLRKGDVLLTIVGTIGRSAILKEANKLTFQRSVAYLRPDENILTSSNFLFSLSKSSNFQNQLKKRTVISAQPGIYLSDIDKLNITIPELKEEQDKIASIIITIDSILSLQQRKLEQLKQLKKAILQIIASNRLLLHTKKVDMIKVRVADIYKITRGNVLSRSEISNVRTSKYPYPVYSSQTKNHGLMGYYKDFLFKNAITWTTDGANAGTVKYRKGRFYSTNVNGVLLSSEGLANQLTAELLNLVAFKYVSHVGNPKLMNNTMGEIIFNIPRSVETQQYFSGCIESVIDLIGKQEKATDKLNKLKKYLLQKLFI